MATWCASSPRVTESRAKLAANIAVDQGSTRRSFPMRSAEKGTREATPSTAKLSAIVPVWHRRSPLATAWWTTQKRAMATNEISHATKTCQFSTSAVRTSSPDARSGSFRSRTSRVRMIANTPSLTAFIRSTPNVSPCARRRAPSASPVASAC